MAFLIAVQAGFPTSTERTIMRKAWEEGSGVSKLVPRKEFGCLAGIETASRIPELKRDWIDELDAMDDEDD